MNLAAETAYLFRHALMRDAAYQLQLPGDRARLHGLAFAILEQACGGRPADPPLEQGARKPLPRHAADPLAFELASNARLSGERGDVVALYLRRAAEFEDRGFRHDSALDHWQRLADESTGAARGVALMCAGGVARLAGRTAVALRIMEEALRLWREVGNRRFEGQALANLANVYRITGPLDRAVEAYEAALPLLRDAGDRGVEGMTLGFLGAAHAGLGLIEQAEREYLEALAILRESGHREFEAITHGNLGGHYLQMERYDEAERYCEEALAEHRLLGNRRFEGIVLNNLCIVYQNTKRLAQAERAGAESLSILREVGDRQFEGMALGNFAQALRLRGRLDEAEAAFSAAFDILVEVGDRRGSAVVSCWRGILRLSQGRSSEAGPLWRDGIAALVALGDFAQAELERDVMKDACRLAGVPPLE